MECRTWWDLPSIRTPIDFVWHARSISFGESVVGGDVAPRLVTKAYPWDDGA